MLCLQKEVRPGQVCVLFHCKFMLGFHWKESHRHGATAVWYLQLAERWASQGEPLVCVPSAALLLLLGWVLNWQVLVAKLLISHHHPHSSAGCIWLGKLWRRTSPRPSKRVAFIRSEWWRKFEKSLNVYLEIWCRKIHTSNVKKA